MDVLSPHLSLTFVILIDSATDSPVHVLMLSTQAVRGLPRLRAPGIVLCIISFSRQLPCFLMVWPQYASFLAMTVSNSSLFTPALLRTHSLVFFAVNETCRIFLSTSIWKGVKPCFFILLLLPLHPFNGLFSTTTWVRRYQKEKPVWI